MDEMIPTELRNPETGELNLNWQTVFEEYAPQHYTAYKDFSASLSGAQQLDKKTTELIMIAIDSVVSWPSPFIDVHIHAALDEGATIQEVIESILIAFKARGGHALNHGLTALGKTLIERNAAGVVTNR